jgi:hypothetical protein
MPGPLSTSHVVRSCHLKQPRQRTFSLSKYALFHTEIFRFGGSLRLGTTASDVLPLTQLALMPEIAPAEIEAETCTLLREKSGACPGSRDYYTTFATADEEHLERYRLTLVKEAAQRFANRLRTDPEI